MGRHKDGYIKLALLVAPYWRVVDVNAQNLDWPSPHALAAGVPRGEKNLRWLHNLQLYPGRSPLGPNLTMAA